MLNKKIACFLWPFILWICATMARAEVHSLRTDGKTLVEAESYSATSKDYPYAEPSKKCSGGKNLGYFWKGSWFEIQVSVPQNCEYTLSMRASSEKGTNIAVLLDGDERNSRKFDSIEVPNTRDWARYTITDSVSLALTQGVHTLRFSNLVDGANIDYLTFSAATKSDQIVTYSPKKTAGPDKNPLKGFGSGWWRPDDDYASVGFQYIEWGLFEPQDDQFNWKYVEEVLERKGTLGRHLIVQFVVDWDHRSPVDANYIGPKWLLEKVGEHRGHAIENDPTTRPMRATNYNHPQYSVEAIEAIEALTKYFESDPRVFVLQAGLLGFWSEWHTFPRTDWNPSKDTKAALLDAYFRNLPKNCFTQIRYPNEPSVTPRLGIGYTNGSATPTKHGYEFGEEIEKRSLWKNGPIAGEWPPGIEQDYWQRFFLTDEGEKFIRQARYSTLLMPEAKEIKEKLPSWSSDGRFLEMHRLLGYNFRVDQIRQAVSKKSGLLHFEVKLENSGIAPFYCNWNLQLGILDSDGKVIETLPIDTDLRRIAPGESVLLKAASRKTIESGKHRIGLRIIQPGAELPKPTAWKLDPRNVYVVLASDSEVIEGVWGKDHAFQGGWNVLGDVAVAPKLPVFDSTAFPFSGSVRPAKREK